MDAAITPPDNIFTLLKRNRMPIFLSGFSLFLVLVFLYYFYIPPATRIGPEQPIPFSHRVHAGIKEIQCQFCHPFVGRSTSPGIPPVEKCLFCHKYIIANHPEIQKVHRYFNSGVPIPWKNAVYLPEHVFFNHERHIKKDIACQECHGPVEAMDRIGRTDFQMGFCVTCHEKENANLDCWLACHN
jgi:hypothetical protein